MVFRNTITMKMKSSLASPEQGFLIEHTICRHIYWDQKIWMRIEVNEGNVTGRQVLRSNSTIDKWQHLGGNNENNTVITCLS